VAAKPALLSGGNPQIAKADGDAPVQGYIAAMPGWKTRRRAPPRRAHHAHRPRRAQGRQVELGPSMASRGRAGSSTFIASRSTSKWLSSAACHCVVSSPASPSTGKCATSISTRTISSTSARGELDSAGFGAARLGPVASAGILAIIVGRRAESSRERRQQPAHFRGGHLLWRRAAVNGVLMNTLPSEGGGGRCVVLIANPRMRNLARGHRRSTLWSETWKFS
jgi:hypothetical protein